MAVQVECARDNVQVPAQQIDAREGQVFGAHHQGNQEVSEHRRDRRDQEEEHHDQAVHGEQLVVGIGLHQVARRSEQFQPDQQGEESADKEKDSDRHQVQQGDPLVVHGQQPRLDAIVLVQIVLAFVGYCCGGHDYCTFASG